MPEPSVSPEIDAGPDESRPSRRSRCSSPSAAKTVAVIRLLDRSGKVLRQVLQLSSPAGVVLPVRRCSAGGRQRIEPGLGHCKPGAFGHVFQLENDQGARLVRILARITARLPTPGEEPLRLHLLDRDVHGEMLIAWDGDRPLDPDTGPKGVLENRPEPTAQLAGLGERAPNTEPRGLEDDGLLDPISTSGA